MLKIFFTYRLCLFIAPAQGISYGFAGNRANGASNNDQKLRFDHIGENYFQIAFTFTQS
jgi:hypothetical protein